MPILKLTGDGNDHHRIYATMVFPNDALFRNGYLRMLMQEGRLAIDSDVPESDRRNSPRWDEIKVRATETVRSGILAGNLLAVLAVMDATGARDPSSRRAAQAVERFYMGKTYGDGKPIRASTRKIEGIDFARCRCVAHLWAALAILRAEHGENAKGKMREKRGLKRFLREAAYFQAFGMNTQTPRTNLRNRHPLLEAKSLWCVPPDIAPINVSELPPFKPVMLDILKNYERY